MLKNTKCFCHLKYEGYLSLSLKIILIFTVDHHQKCSANAVLLYPRLACRKTVHHRLWGVDSAMRIHASPSLVELPRPLSANGWEDVDKKEVKMIQYKYINTYNIFFFILAYLCNVQPVESIPHRFSGLSFRGKQIIVSFMTLNDKSNFLSQSFSHLNFCYCSTVGKKLRIHQLVIIGTQEVRWSGHPALHRRRGYLYHPGLRRRDWWQVRADIFRKYSCRGAKWGRALLRSSASR